MKQYKLVAGPTTSQIISADGSNSDAVRSFENLIAQHASAGWTYHSMEPISTSQTKGCFFNRQTTYSTFYMLVFERETGDTSYVEAAKPAKKAQPQPQPAAAPVQGDIFCTNCGMKNPAGTGFCKNCGQKLIK